MTIAALSGALTGPPAFAFQSDLENPTSVELRLDAGTVLATGFDHADDPQILFDIEAELEIETLTESGRRWGFVAGGRIEQDSGRRAWGGLSGQCPPGIGDCATALINGLPVPAGNPVSGFYSSGSASDEGVRLAVDAAYGFVHTGWGEVRLGYGPGAALLDMANGPTAFRLSRADNGRVDLTGISGARTWNYASGYDPKIVFRSIQLGQVSTIGSFRVSASFTPEVRECGVDVCAREFGPAGRVDPVTDSVMEVAGRYDVRRGETEIAVSLSWSRGSEASGRTEFDDLESRTVGLSWRKGAWLGGARWLRSNSAIAGDGTYEALSVSGGYEAGDWLTTLEWANFSDNFVHVDGHTWQLSTSRLIGEHWVLGAGIQDSTRSDPVITPSGRRVSSLEASSVFVELGWRF